MRLKLLSLLVVFTAGFSGTLKAQIDSLPNERHLSTNFDQQINHYLKKSKNQKKLAWIFLGGGMALEIVGSSLADQGNDINPSGGYQVLSTVGGLASIGSIPLFFAASKNKNKAQSFYFQKSIAMAATDSLRRIYTEDAADYFKTKARANTTTAIVMSAVGTAALIGGIATANNNNDDDVFDAVFGNSITGIFLVTTGVLLDVLSIPFYVRGAQLRNNAKVILRTGRIPNVDLGSVSPTIKAGQYVAIGVAIQL